MCIVSVYQALPSSLFLWTGQACFLHTRSLLFSLSLSLSLTIIFEFFHLSLSLTLPRACTFMHTCTHTHTITPHTTPSHPHHHTHTITPHTITPHTITPHHHTHTITSHTSHHTPHHHTPHTITYNSSWWSQVEEGPPDAIFGLVEAHKKDPRPNKVTLAIGAYRDDKGRPFVLPTVKKVLIHRRQ